MSKKIYIDQMQRTVEVSSTVLRIVSLVPSQTELLVDLGLENKLVGITKFCVHPAHLKSKVAQVGGTKQVKIDLVRNLKPDLIIGNKEENTKEDIALLEQIAPVWMSDVNTLNDALEMIQSIGRMNQKLGKAKALCEEIALNFHLLKQGVSQSVGKALYLIWKNPYLAAGKNTFIDAMLQEMGLENVLSESRYPEVSFDTVVPDLVFLSTEPYPFSEKEVAELENIFPQAKVCLVDGEYFSWYGSRLKEAPTYFSGLLKNL